MKAIRDGVTIEATPLEAWEAWTTVAGLRSFLAPQARMELRIGGPFEAYFDPEAPKGSRGSEGMKVLSFVPEEMLSFTWTAPPEYPEVRGEKMWVVLQFEQVAPRRTRIALTHLGWREGGQWDDVFHYFTRAWRTVLGRLEYRFAVGPVDWANPPR
jgi:uncharacterized protein YndB with AHSA1/START domain